MSRRMAEPRDGVVLGQKRNRRMLGRPPLRTKRGRKTSQAEFDRESFFLEFSRDPTDGTPLLAGRFRVAMEVTRQPPEPGRQALELVIESL
jgi:hypothetical protein